MPIIIERRLRDHNRCFRNVGTSSLKDCGGGIFGRNVWARVSVGRPIRAMIGHSEEGQFGGAKFRHVPVP